MKLLLSLLLSLNVMAAEEPYSARLYKENAWNIFVYTCEKTADCLGVDAGWGDFKEKRGDGKFQCFLHGDEIGGNALEIDNYEKLLTKLSQCRSNSLKLLENK